MKTKALLTSLLLIVAHSATSFAAQLQHAEFAFDGAAITRELSAGSVTVAKPTTLYCQAVISAIGSTEQAVCYSDEGRQALADQVAEAVAEQDFWPAHVSGRAVAVRANFRVVLESGGEGLTANVFPNLGAMQAEYGPHYVEPQERLDSPSWYHYFSARERSKTAPFFAKGVGMVRVAATVATSGQADEVGVVQADRAYRSAAKTLRQGVRQAQFIPGHVDGKPVPMPYLAVVSFKK